MPEHDADQRLIRQIGRTSATIMFAAALLVLDFAGLCAVVPLHAAGRAQDLVPPAIDLSALGVPLSLLVALTVTDAGRGAQSAIGRAGQRFLVGTTQLLAIVIAAIGIEIVLGLLTHGTGPLQSRSFLAFAFACVIFAVVCQVARQPSSRVRPMLLRSWRSP